MKSKEEILYDLGLGLDPESDILILNAMDEYAQQFNVNCNLKEDTCSCAQKQILHIGPHYKECGKCGKRIL